MSELVLGSVDRLLRAGRPRDAVRTELVALGLYAGGVGDDALDVPTREALVARIAGVDAGLALELATALFVLGPRVRPDTEAYDWLEAGGALALVDARGTTRAHDVDVIGLHDGAPARRTIEVVREHVGLGLVPMRVFHEGLSMDPGALRAIASVARGVLVAAAETGRAYADERAQFGRPIASLGAIAEKLDRAASRVRDARVGDDAEAARAVTSAALEVAHDTLQIHGGYGFTREYAAERLYRDALELHRAAGATHVPVPTLGALAP